VAGVLGAAVYVAWPDIIVQTIVWVGTAVSSAALIIVGTIRNRAPDRLPWWLIAGAQVGFVAGDVIQYALPDAAWAFGACYIASYTALGLALLRIVRIRSTGRDLPAMLDAVAISTGLLLLAWVLLIGPYSRDVSLGLVDKVAAIAYPCADVAVLAVLARLWSGGGERRAPYYILGTAVVFLFGSDLVFSALTLLGNPVPGSVTDAGFLVPYVLFGAAALHPAMGTISAPADPGAVRPSPFRLALLAGASLIAPGVLVMQWVREETIDAPIIAVTCVVLFLITLFRMQWLSAEVTRQQERKGLLARVLQATEEERTRIASDLHDGPVQQLAILSYNAHRARKQLSNENYQAVDTLLDKVERSLEGEVVVLRRLMSDLRPPVLDNRGLAEALAEHVEGFQRDTSIDAGVVAELPERLAPELETVLYRVVQESLNNVSKHAQASRVRVEVSTADGEVRLRVTDDGRGFDAHVADQLLREGHFGLAGMKERVALAGGSLGVQSSPGRGTTIEVDLPVRTAG
jgi:signal transduction histidine kinase